MWLLAKIHRMLVLSILSLTPTLINYAEEGIRIKELIWSYFETDISSAFDYVIVGGGSAGSVLAARLSEDPDVTVLLLEAGGPPSVLTGIPSFTPFLQLTNYDWAFKTKPQTHACKGMDDNSCRWPRGKMLGGTGGINYMLYVRGNRKDYDEWSEMGFEGWSYEEVLPYFKKSEKQMGQYSSDSVYHSTSGSLPVSDPPYVTRMAGVYKNLATKAGFSIRDYNAENQTGFNVPQLTMLNGWRMDSYRSYLKPVMNTRKNLKVLSYSHVNKIIFDRTKRASGVEVLRFHRKMVIKARQEIILSAGAIGSPAVLMRSGIGHKEHLKELGIPLVADLPVGDNLQDHVTTMLGPLIVNQSYSFDVIDSVSLKTIWDFFVYGKGPLTTSVVCDLVGFPEKDNQIHYLSIPFYADYGIKSQKIFGIRQKLWEDYFSKFYGQPSVTILPVLLRPKSRGTVRLRSADPNEAPVIDPNYFSDPRDLEDLSNLIEWTMNDFLREDLVKPYGLRHPKDGKLPDCLGIGIEYWKCYVQHYTLTMYHPVGTVPMGTVLDSNLRVKTVEGLRVVDASAMPLIVRGNPNAPVVMMAEKAADLILSTTKKTAPKNTARDEL